MGRHTNILLYMFYILLVWNMVPFLIEQINYYFNPPMFNMFMLVDISKFVSIKGLLLTIKNFIQSCLILNVSIANFHSENETIMITDTIIISYLELKYCSLKDGGWLCWTKYIISGTNTMISISRAGKSKQHAKANVVSFLKSQGDIINQIQDIGI